MAFPCPPPDDSGNNRQSIVLAKCTPNIAFCCPPKDSAEKKLAALQGMKDVICRMENELRVKVEPQVACLTCTPCCMPPGCPPQCNPCCPPPMCIPVCADNQNECCPPCCPPCCQPCPSPCPPNNCDDDCEPPDVMVCYRIACSGSGGKKKKKNQKSEVIRVKKSKSRELRAGILYTGCNCEKRNGLQDQCMRTDCQGSPACLTSPEPTCGPSEYAGAKHLEKKYGRPFVVGQQKNSGKAEEDDEDGDYVEEEYQCFPAYIKGNGDFNYGGNGVSCQCCQQIQDPCNCNCNCSPPMPQCVYAPPCCPMMKCFPKCSPFMFPPKKCYYPTESNSKCPCEQSNIPSPCNFKMCDQAIECCGKMKLPPCCPPYDHEHAWTGLSEKLCPTCRQALFNELAAEIEADAQKASSEVASCPV